MSLLKRIERARPAAEGEASNLPAVPQAPVAPRPGGAPATPPDGGTTANRPFLGAMPARESFREVAAPAFRADPSTARSAVTRARLAVAFLR